MGMGAGGVPRDESACPLIFWGKKIKIEEQN
jgi:hypothetical protein